MFLFRSIPFNISRFQFHLMEERFHLWLKDYKCFLFERICIDGNNIVAILYAIIIYLWVTNDSHFSSFYLLSKNCSLWCPWASCNYNIWSSSGSKNIPTLSLVQVRRNISKRPAELPGWNSVIAKCFGIQFGWLNEFIQMVISFTGIIFKEQTPFNRVESA